MQQREGFHWPKRTWQPSLAERRVLDALVQGVSNPAIAAQLGLSVETVKTHIGHLLAATQCSTREELAQWWTVRRGTRWSILPLLSLSRLAAATVVTGALGAAAVGASLALNYRARAPSPRTTSLACQESPVLGTTSQALTGAVVVDRDGGAVVVRMPTLIAGHESKVLWRPQNGYRDATLEVTAIRLDAVAPPVSWTLLHATLDRARTIDGGYPSGITLPTAGCWQLTAHMGITDADVTVRVSS